MEDGCRPCAYAKREKHVSNLTYGRIGQYALEVPLRQGTEACHQ